MTPSISNTPAVSEAWSSSTFSQLDKEKARTIANEKQKYSLIEKSPCFYGEIVTDKLIYLSKPEYSPIPQLTKRSNQRQTFTIYLRRPGRSAQLHSKRQP